MLIALLSTRVVAKPAGDSISEADVFPAVEDSSNPITVSEIAVTTESISLTTESTVTTEAVVSSENDLDNNEITNTDAKNEFLKSYATKMLSYMNLTVKPCDDFYEYACGNWKNVKPERQTENKRSNLLDIVYTLADVSEQLLVSDTQLATDLGYGNEMKIAQQFYNACLNAELYPLPAADPAYLKLIRSIGGFPAIDGEAWQASNFSWFNMSAHLTNYGGMGLIYEDILGKHPFQPYFKLPELGFDFIVHSDNIATNDTKGYKRNEKRMHEYLMANGLSEEKTADVIAGVFAFWREALQVADRFNENEEKCEELTRTENLKLFSGWKDYYDIVWGGMEHFGVYPPEHFCDFYYHELDKVCAKHKEAVANYLAMKLLFTMDSKLKSTKFQRESCLLEVQSSVPYLLDKLYYTKYITKETQSDILEIIKELREFLYEVLNNATWIDEETRKEALLKESKITTRIGSFKDEHLTELLIREMNNLTFVSDSYTQSTINLRKFCQYMKRYNSIHHKLLSNKTEQLEFWLGMQVNAFYYLLDNSINVMSGVLHPPAYHHDWPNSLKYGTFGYLVGHELSHGFDSDSSIIDSKGKIRNWWSKMFSDEFNNRIQCFIDQYNKYHVPQINRTIDGDNTKNENMADIGGLYEAINAYRLHTTHHKQLHKQDMTYDMTNEQMPGIDLSPEQLFFLGFAQVWCSDYKEEHYWEELTHRHAVDKFRVIGAVSNSDDFAKAYNCPVGSPMNPNTKCHIW
ncbi:neprilysin-2-like [Drosophila sulfurigaster albostrigata]|uniref:neprilysin-2-like n=1 Tax=Drosophila sulfurigaster albostrigata TaxID=89887 RepID=UPI002D218F45|nr:neprilysin-2-like [Drosophila sulfurigaster albostrigata]